MVAVGPVVPVATVALAYPVLADVAALGLGGTAVALRGVDRRWCQLRAPFAVDRGIVDRAVTEPGPSLV